MKIGRPVTARTRSLYEENAVPAAAGSWGRLFGDAAASPGQRCEDLPPLSSGYGLMGTLAQCEGKNPAVWGYWLIKKTSTPCGDVPPTGRTSLQCGDIPGR